MSKRKFRPRKNLPRDKLEQYLAEGYTLQEIGRKFNTSTSYISEYLTMLGIDKDDFAERKENKSIRRKEGKKLSFIEEFWELIRFEIGKWGVLNDRWKHWSFKNINKY